MKSNLLSLFSIIFSCTTIFAQDFVGYVKKADSTSSPIFQAKVEITEGNKPFKTFKTYFDGSFKFTPNKSQTYLIKISYSGYTDSAYTITTDKNAKADVQSVAVKLKKDGMRLMGMVKSREEDFPIKGATVVVRNVMTRKEDRITTDIDGKYNFKLEYETNYKVWIDKRSTGIFNVYKDTSFYISTIGFNQPLDYKLDIFLDWMENATTTVREGYNASKQPANKNLKPVISILNNESKSEEVQKNTVPLIANSAEEEKKEDAIKKPKKNSTKDVSDTSATVSKQKVKSKKKKEEIEVITIRDTGQVVSKSPSETKADESVNLLEMTRQKALAEKKAREAEEEETAKVAKETEEKRKAKELAVQKNQQELITAAEILAKRTKFIQDSTIWQKTKEDSLMRAKQKNDSIILVAAQKQKMKNDSILKAKTQMAKIEKELAAKEKAKQDSIVKTKFQQEQAHIKTKQYSDSTSQIIPSSLNKAIKDSSSPKKTFYLTKTQEELIAAAEIFAKRKKFVQDSIEKVKAVEMKKSSTQEQKKK